MPEAVPDVQPVLPQEDPEGAARVVRRVFKKITQEIDVNKYGLSGLLIAIEKALGIRNEAIEASDQTALVEFFGLEATTQFLILCEGTPAIPSNRARELSHIFELFIQAIRQEAGMPTLLRLGRRAGHEFINALADDTIRS